MKEPNDGAAFSKHLLLRMAKTYPVSNEDLAPQECQYDLFQGAWVLNGLGSLLIESTNRPSPMSKKKDIETGEDQKAE